VSFFIEKLLEAREISLAFLNSKTQYPTTIPLGIRPASQNIIDGEGILGYLQAQQGEPIKVYDTITEKNVNGYFVKYDSTQTPSPHIDIYYNPTLNTCWRRFIIAKELSHLILGDKNHNFTGTISSIEAIFNKLQRKQFTNENDNNAIAVEMMAYYTAIEFLLPWHPNYGMKAVDMYKQGMSYYDIADEFKIPELIVLQYLDSYIYRGICKY
jgi:Zn-dependent peptidase ImmA (M78 family)